MSRKPADHTRPGTADQPAPATERGGRTVTMQEVADAAGVSIATVSHVVNNKKGARIGADARRRVTDAIRELGYRPNTLAQTLASGHSKFIGVIADAVATTPFAGKIIHGAQEEAWKHGYVLLVANTEGNHEVEQEALAMMLEHQVRGILYSTWYHRQADIPDSARETDTVLVDCYSPVDDLPTVVPDEIQGGRAATHMLTQAGHKRIAFINTTTPSPAREGRLVGYEHALAAADIDFDPALVLDASPDQEGGYTITEQLLALGATGVFCHNDRVAMGLYDGLRDNGLTIPHDIAVVGFDNQEIIAAHLRPPLSTVALPHYELGAVGIRTLLGLDQPTHQGRIKVPCPPVPRQSV